jgi:hypothetical protein
VCQRTAPAHGKTILMPTIFGLKVHSYPLSNDGKNEGAVDGNQN